MVFDGYYKSNLMYVPSAVFEWEKRWERGKSYCASPVYDTVSYGIIHMVDEAINRPNDKSAKQFCYTAGSTTTECLFIFIWNGSLSIMG